MAKFGSRLIDVSDVALKDLAQLDSAALDLTISTLLPKDIVASDFPCGASASRLWQNYPVQL